MMKYCSKCGNRLKEEDVFCSVCGAKTSIFGVYEEPEILTKKKVVRKGTTGTGMTGTGITGTGVKKTSDTGTRYTAALEQNAIAVSEYLKKASDMEWQKYELNEISKKLKSREENCLKEIAKQDDGLKTNTEEAQETERKIRDYKKLDYRKKVYSFKLGFDPLIFLIALAVMIGLCVLGGVFQFAPLAGIFGSGVSVALKVIIIIGVPVIVEAIVQIVKYFRGKNEHNKAEDAAKEQFEEEQEELEKSTMETLNKDLEDYRSLAAKYSTEKAKLENISLAGIRAEIEANDRASGWISDALEKYYSIKVLAPKYRDLVAVSTMYEYFSQGRCMELTGHDGAYDLFEKELKENIITDKFSEITGNIGQIGESQKNIISQAVKMNGKTEALVDSVDRVISKDLSRFPDGNVNKPLDSSEELRKYYSDVESMIDEQMEYLSGINRTARRWF